MGEKEADVLAERSRDAQANEDRMARKASGGRGFGGNGNGRGRGGKDVSEDGGRAVQAAMAALAAGADGENADPADGGACSNPGTSPDSDNDGISKDPTMMSAAKRAMFEERRRGHRGLEGDVLSREARSEGWRARLARASPGVLRGFQLGPALLLSRRRVVDLVLSLPLRAHGVRPGGRARRADREVDYGVPFAPFEQLLAMQPRRAPRFFPSRSVGS